eukprot:COSAG01_NODE_2067_length_8506_cov_221.825384_9_plen_70_part_00
MRWVQGGEAGQQASSGQNKAVRRLSNGEMRAEMRGWSGKMALVKYNLITPPLPAVGQLRRLRRSLRIRC